MTNNGDIDWEPGTWEGSRRAQLRASLKLTPKQRFEALEQLADTSRWLAGAGKKDTVNELHATYERKTHDD